MPLCNWDEFGDGRSVTNSRRDQVDIVSMQKGEQQHRIGTIQSFGEYLGEQLFVERVPREFGGHNNSARPTTEGFYDTRPQRSGRCKCHEHLTKRSLLEQRARVCRRLHRRKMPP